MAKKEVKLISRLFNAYENRVRASIEPSWWVNNYRNLYLLVYLKRFMWWFPLSRKKSRMKKTNRNKRKTKIMKFYVWAHTLLNPVCNFQFRKFLLNETFPRIMFLNHSHTAHHFSIYCIWSMKYGNLCEQ